MGWQWWQGWQECLGWQGWRGLKGEDGGDGVDGCEGCDVGDGVDRGEGGDGGDRVLKEGEEEGNILAGERTDKSIKGVARCFWSKNVIWKKMFFNGVRAVVGSTGSSIESCAGFSHQKCGYFAFQKYVCFPFEHCWCLFRQVRFPLGVRQSEVCSVCTESWVPARQYNTTVHILGHWSIIITIAIIIRNLIKYDDHHQLSREPVTQYKAQVSTYQSRGVNLQSFKRISKEPQFCFSQIPRHICTFGVSETGDRWVMTSSRPKLGLIESQVQLRFFGFKTFSNWLSQSYLTLDYKRVHRYSLNEHIYSRDLSSLVKHLFEFVFVWC